MWLEKETKSWKTRKSSSQVTLSLSLHESAQGKPRLCRLWFVGCAWAMSLTCINQLYCQVPFQQLKNPAPLFRSAAETSPGDATSATPQHA